MAAGASMASFTFDIPSGSLSDALAELARQSGVSIGMSGSLPSFSVRRLKGRLTAAQALDRLLRGSDLRAVPLGPSSFKLQHVAPSKTRSRSAQPNRANTAEDIVVTGVKRSQLLESLPVSVSVVPLSGEGFMRSLPSSEDIAATVSGLTITNLGSGRNRQFIRGVADSPFSGNSQSTVAIQLDETRLSFDAPDPDVRLIDVDRVEVLKGPQGPLYGSGALGGVYHIVTRRPDLDNAGAYTGVDVLGVASGGIGYSVQAMINVPLIDDRVGFRFLGYKQLEPGWISSRDKSRKNSNETHVLGERYSFRYQMTEDWRLDMIAAAQFIDQEDSQYVVNSSGSFVRSNDLSEVRDNDFRMVGATITGRIGAIDLLSATSMVSQEVSGTLDASSAAATFGLTAPLAYAEERYYHIFNHEFRLSRSREEGVSWIAGLSWLNAESTVKGDLVTTTDLTTRVISARRETTELAGFAELSVPLLKAVKFTGGGRVFRTIARDERNETDEPRSDRLVRTSFTPSLTLSWKPKDTQFYFIRYASALRPGGLSPSGVASNNRFASDKLINVDLGWRLRSRDRRLSIEGGVYLSHWRDIQSDYLLANGLVATHNAGNGRIAGLEVALAWQPTGAWSIESGFTAQRARLVKAESTAVIGNDGRLPVVPDKSARVSISRKIQLATWQGSISARANYVGPSHLSFDQGLDRRMGQYLVADCALSLSQGDWTIAVRVDNVFQTGSDSFSFGNPFSLRSIDQFTPIRPRTLTFGLSKAW
jgi:iron complex outermembrane recepter protein